MPADLAAAEPPSDAPRGARSVTRVAAAAIGELDNPVQVDVLRRIQRLMTGAVRPAGSRRDDT